MNFLDSNGSLSETNSTSKALQVGISPLLDVYASRIIRYVVGFSLVGLAGVLGTFMNAANICVYLKMGIKETTNMSFFALSVSDLLVCVFYVLATVCYTLQVLDKEMRLGTFWFQVGLATTYVAYPSLGCSAWVTAVLSVERFLCIAMPLKVKEIITPQRTRFLILIMATYQSVFLVLFFVNPGPPYDAIDFRRTLYFNCSFSVLSFICFLIVSVFTALLIIRLRRSLEWRHEITARTAQSSRESGITKEKKATRSVLAICVIFIACYSLNSGLFFAVAVYKNFNHLDPYLGTLFMSIHSFTNLLQVLCSAVNIFVYYKVSTKYREVFRATFCHKANQSPRSQSDFATPVSVK